MAFTPNNTGSFVPTTNVWDVNQIYSTEVNSPEFKELLVRLYQNINNIANVLNVKDTGVYNTFELINGQQFFPDPTLNSSTSGFPIFRQVYRKVINFGALPNAGTKTVPHYITITGATTFTRIYGAASNPTSEVYIPLPFSSPTALADNIELYVDGTNVGIITGLDESAFTTTYIILEYLQS
jgi:hypothetical protein